MAAQIGYPLVAKPDQQGSSLGIRFVDDPAQLIGAIEEVFEFGPFCVLESVVAGEEWTVGVIDNLLLPPIRIEVPEGFYDFDFKYRDERTEYHIETAPMGTIAARVSHVGARAAAALGTAGVAESTFVSTQMASLGPRGQHGPRHDQPQPRSQGSSSHRLGLPGTL